MRVEFTIPGEPASKSNSRKLVKFGDRPASIKSDKARAYERTAGLLIPASARLMLEGDLRVTIHIFYASRRPDLDESVILDVMQAKFAKTFFSDGKRQCIQQGVYLNDRQVKEKHIFHGLDKVNPRAEIVVETI